MKRKKNKISNYMLIGIIYTIILLTISTAYSFLNEDLSINATAGIPQSGEDYIIDYTEVIRETEDDISYYGYDVILTYLGQNTTSGWEVYIKIPYDTEVTECNNASSCTVDGETLIIKNDTTNGVLSPDNNSASFGVKFKTSQSDYTFEVTGVKFIEAGDEEEDPITPEEPDPDIPSVEYINTTFNVLYDWGVSKHYVFTIENTSDTTTLDNWNATFQIPEDAEIKSVWGGDYTYDETSKIVTVTGPSWSPSLAPKTTLEVNMIVNSQSQGPTTFITFNGITTVGDQVTTYGIN